MLGLEMDFKMEVEMGGKVVLQPGVWSWGLGLMLGLHLIHTIHMPVTAVATDSLTHRAAIIVHH